LVLAAVAVALLLPATAAAAQVKAGAAVEDASWHVGASGGQYGTTGPGGAAGGDIHQHSSRRVPSYGVHSRLDMRALVVEGADGRRMAIVKNDLYIPQDLLWRRTAQILESKNVGIDRGNLTMAVTHDHSSPYYTSPSWGVWTFQDVFDFRAFEYYAQAMARAVERAAARLVPVRVGASVTDYGLAHRNVPGPTIADDGTPAGFPHSYSDHDLIVVRFETFDGKSVANLVNYSVHPEDLDGIDLISADFIGPLQRMSDRDLGGVTIYTQGAVGNSEPERYEWHDVHTRALFYHHQYAQSEFKARGLSTAIADTSRDVQRGSPEDPERFAPLRSDFGKDDVAFVDRWFPGPLSHPYPGVSNCRTDEALEGDPRYPVVGLPDCNKLQDIEDPFTGTGPGDVPVDLSPFETGVTTDTIQQHGIPVPENYSAPAYTGLEENVSVHLQAFKIGDILFTVCSCEQWADQSKNIKTRTDRRAGNQWVGFDWSAQCTRKSTELWSCPNPGNPSQRIDTPDAAYQRMKAQVNKDATGWDDPANVAFAESEPTDPNDPRFWGNYSHDDSTANLVETAEANRNAELGYAVTVPIGMANDYNGYIVTYREYQRGDHYRKALNAWGPHASDYMATRLVNMGRHLRRIGEPGRTDPFANDPYPPISRVNAVDEWPGGAAKTMLDLEHNEGRAQAIGELSANGIREYERSLPDDRAAKVVTHPGDVERFGAATFTWVGGSNFSDNPRVRVQRFDDGKWTEYADQSGEVPVTLKYPPAEEGPAYRVSGSEYQWTAHFEAFVSWFDLGDRPRATPPGVYRFVVEGQRKQGSGPVPYKLESRSFAVGPWSGVALQDFGDGGFTVGPRRTIKVPKQGNNPEVEAQLGPIDYPDTYKSTVPYIKPDRFAVRDPAAPNDPSLFEWFCHGEARGCAFRPWLDTGDLARVVFTFVSPSGKVDRVAGAKQGDRWVAGRARRSGESVYIESGDACDAWGNYNGKPTAVVGNARAVPDKPPAGFACVPRVPAEDVPGGTAGGSGSGAGSGAAAGGSNPLGLPPKSKCIDQRRFKFKIHQPPRQRVVNVNVYINGKRRYSRRGKQVKTISIKKLPSTGRYVVRIVALTNIGRRVISTRTYKNCRKGKPSTRVDRGKGGKR
jgi:hypothetical protein